MNDQLHRWSTGTKRMVTTVILLLLAVAIYRIRALIPPFVLALLLAFVLDPVVDFLTVRLKVSRGLVTGLVFLVLVIAMLLVVATPMTIIPSVSRAVLSVQADVIRILTDIGDFLERPVVVGDYTLDLSNVYTELSKGLRAIVTSAAQGTLNLVFSIASGALWLMMILMIAFYLVKDADRIIAGVDGLAPPGYHDDFVRLRKQITAVWSAFLRGQVLLGAAMVVITTAVCTIVGLPYAFALGLLAGVMEFIPSLGPILALIPAVLLALFQGSSYLPMSNFWFAVLVTGLYLLIQQVEGNLLVPRILGHSLNLHPLAVLVGIIIGGSLWGILGMLLAAPVLATLRVIGHYVFCRLYDRDPFAEPEKAAQPRLVERAYQAARERLRGRRKLGPQEVLLRPARLEDGPAAEEIVNRIWGQRDYVPETWQRWVEDSAGEFVAAEVNGRLVGFAKAERLAADEWWLAGLRVAPDYQGRGIARRLQTYLVEHIRRRGPGVIRLATHHKNYPVHHMAASDGFQRKGVYRSYRATPLPGDVEGLRRLTGDDLSAAWQLIADSPRFRATGGLYEHFWDWLALTRERLAELLAQGAVWGWEEDGELAALALLFPIRDGTTLFIGYADGRDAALPPLLKALRHLAAQEGREEVRIRPVEEPGLLAAVEAAGFEFQEKPPVIWVFERALDGEVAE